ncbi:hypothetical protein ALTERO38_50659 [Alteromonas sp. 38]|nr:hypothetical protein ALTER154_80608 [Alteromonas sp. 154]VXB42921.1 hypothetical protein ALTERO38_50659 [Alteromonas sp. 38]
MVCSCKLHREQLFQQDQLGIGKAKNCIEPSISLLKFNSLSQPMYFTSMSTEKS